MLKTCDDMRLCTHVSATSPVQAWSCAGASLFLSAVSMRLTPGPCNAGGPSRADTESRWGNKFVPSSSGGGFEDRDRGSSFGGDRDRGSSFGGDRDRGDIWGRRPSEGEPPAGAGQPGCDLRLPEILQSSAKAEVSWAHPVGRPAAAALMQGQDRCWHCCEEQSLF